MENEVRLHAQIKSLGDLRYTPAGIPVLTMWLYHESWQTESGREFLAKTEVEAKVLGEMAQPEYFPVGRVAVFSGFLAQKNLRNPRLVLHVQNVYEK